MLSKIEVLADLEEVVAELMAAHEAKRVLWFPSELLEPAPDTDPDHHIRELRRRAAGISPPARVALALNLLTQEGLPHFHLKLAVAPGGAWPWIPATRKTPVSGRLGRRRGERHRLAGTAGQTVWQ